MAETVTLDGQAVAVPWAVWRESSARVLDLPPGWRGELLSPADAPAIGDPALQSALDTPIGGPSLAELAAGKRTAAIAIDDITRPTPTSRIVEHLIARLGQLGFAPGAIQVVVATGAHRTASADDICLKVSENVRSAVSVVSHDPAGPLVDTGVTLAGTPVRLNALFARAELRIGVGVTLPHPFAGFSGGGKIVIPGLADLDTLTRTHKYALMGLRGGSRLEGNTFRRDMEAAVRAIGLHYTVNVVINSRREIAALVCGDMVEAHRAAAVAAGAVGGTPAPTDALDALIVNAYPKDGELLQVEAAFTALRSGMLEWLKPAAPIVLTAACPGGVGHHGLFGPGGRLFRAPAAKAFLGEHPLVVFCPSVSDGDVGQAFWTGYPSFQAWDQVVAWLELTVPPRARIGVVPCGPLQVAMSPPQSTERGA